MIPGESSLKLLDERCEGARALEIGCGAAQNSIVLAKLGYRVTAIDFSKNQLRYAKRLIQEEKVEINLICMDAENLENLMPKYFDFAISAYVLDYISNVESVLRGLYKVLRPDGYAIISMTHPYYNVFNGVREGKMTMEETLSQFLDIYHNLHRVKWSWYFNDGSKITMVRYHRTIEEWKKIFAMCGFRIEKILELKANAFNPRGKPKIPQIYSRSMAFPGDILREKIPYTIIFKVRKLKRAKKYKANVFPFV
jgi:2-polyprenyl-3-methyl-5-hydroxy-6-metoxy-1,4-benzoquinol methylase